MNFVRWNILFSFGWDFVAVRSKQARGPAGSGRCPTFGDPRYKLIYVRAKIFTSMGRYFRYT